MNVFLKYLLDALGYKTFFVIGDIIHPNNHILIVIVGLESPGDKFLVDGGRGLPTFDPIPLNFKNESEMYANSFVKYNFTWKSETLLIRFKYQFKESPNYTIPPGSDVKVCKVNLTPRELTYFNEFFDDVYSNPDITPFHQSLRICLYTKEERKAFVIKDLSYLLEDETHSLQETKLNSAESLLQVIEKAHPILKADAAKAIERLTLFS